MIMKKEPEMKNDGKDFERFEEMVRTVVRVPKEELNRREAEYQAQRKQNGQSKKELARK